MIFSKSRNSVILKTTISQNLDSQVTSKDHGKYLIGATKTGNIVLWNFQTTQIIQNFTKIHKTAITDVVIFQRNNKIISSDDFGNVYFWDVETQKIDFVFPTNTFVSLLENHMFGIK